MLQKLNERFQGVVAWIIITLIAITFTLFGVEYYMQARQTSSQIVAEVNNVPIEKDVFNVKYERMRQSLETRGLPLEKFYKQQLLNELITNQLSLQSAKNNGFSIASSQVDASILHIPQFLENGKFSSARYQQVLSSSLFTHQTFQKEVQEGMLLNQQRFAFIGTAFALPNEIDSYIKLLNQKRNYRYVSIAAERFQKTSHSTPQELQQYYQSHASEFTTPEQVSLEYVQLSMPEIKATVHISDSEIKQYYTENLSLFVNEKGKTLPFEQVKEKIHEQLLAERAQAVFSHQLEALTELAYQTPDELNTVAEQLKLPIQTTAFFSQQEGRDTITKHPKVVQIAFSSDVLGGNNSEPIQLNENSVIVIRVKDHQSPQVRPFDSVKTMIESKVQLEKAQLQAQKLGQALVSAKSNTERDALISEYHLNWTVVNDAVRSNQNPVNQFAFNSLSQIGQYMGRDISTAYVVLELQKITDGILTEVDKDQLAGITEQIETNDGLSDYELYIKQLQDKAKITIN